MADQRTIDTFHEALNFGLQLLGAGDLQLKEKQYEVLKSVVIDNKDVLAVLPTGYGKSLIYQLLAPIYNFLDFAGSPGDKKSTVIVISPLNALIRDQIVKMREGGLNVSVLRGDRVDTEDGNHDVSLDVPVEILSSTHFDLIYTHPEVLIDNKKVSKLLKAPAFIINIC
ncbi:putative ATP-dependent DNA helicase Q1 [Acropora millepora]|uniref:putative ATP-dependent DNA helicase Q1 n=1 Tax=Acropora millepora TaxID=45264 RepID=UPI001CF4DB9F|nr:putative ATP-dependent DNA helicase Q1 [Acropora millepora]